MAKLFSHLLLATEHTPFDAGAEALALAMARRCNVPLAAVLPLVSNPEYEALAPQVAARVEQEAAVRIAELRVQANEAGVAMDLCVRRGEELYREIVQEARARGSDLIIIRRRGKRSFVANLLVGEMVSKVVAHAPCSVLIVTREARMWSRRVLVAAEPGPQGLRLVDTAASVAAECGLPLQLVCIHSEETPPPDIATFVTQAAQLAQTRGVHFASQVRKGKPFEEILAAARDGEADLIVIGSRNDRHIGRALIGGVAQKVVGLSEHPVLVLHPDTHQ